jgi:class 3 adenylate cyclase
MYVLLADRRGAITRAQRYQTDGAVTEAVGGPFSVTDDGPELQELRTWYSGRFQRPFDPHLRLPPESHVFLHPEPLVDFCKKAGFLLHCLPPGDFTAGDPIYPDNPLRALFMTWARKGVPGQSDNQQGTTPHSLDWWVPPEVLEVLNQALRDEGSSVRRVSSWPIVRTFVYLDISDFSKFSPLEEALVINSLVWLVDQGQFWLGDAAGLPGKIEARMCIGDGYIFVFREAMEATYFAAYLAHLIEVAAANDRLPVSFHFRMGVHVGPVYTFWDPGRRDWNYIGDGINGGNRVLSAIDKGSDDMLYVSSEVRQKLMASSGRFQHFARLLRHLHNRGRREDKHRRPWRVYEVGHAAVCENDLPPSSNLWPSVS